MVAELKPHRVEHTVAEIRDAGGRAEGVAVDVGNRGDVEGLIRQTVEQFGRLDVLVNNAQGLIPRVAFEDITDEQFDQVFRTGAKATLWSMQAAFPHMRESGGRIINLISLAAERGDPGLAPYNATKLAILALTRTAAREWGKHNVLVNCIAPAAWSKRGQEYAAHDPERFQRLMAERPIGRMGDPLEDIAPVAVFLASDDSRYVTGNTFYADGGGFLSYG